MQKDMSQQLSTIQYLVKKLCKKSTWANIEKTSRAWKFTCPQCQIESSIWEIGGMRSMAAGSPLRLLYCPRCKQKSKMRLYYKE